MDEEKKWEDIEVEDQPEKTALVSKESDVGQT